MRPHAAKLTRLQAASMQTPESKKIADQLASVKGAARYAAGVHHDQNRVMVHPARCDQLTDQSCSSSHPRRPCSRMATYRRSMLAAHKKLTSHFCASLHHYKGKAASCSSRFHRETSSGYFQNSLTGSKCVACVYDKKHHKCVALKSVIPW